MKTRIKELREQRGLTQQQCADDLNISLRTLQRYEKGECGHMLYFCMLADYFDVELGELFEFKEENK